MSVRTIRVGPAHVPAPRPVPAASAPAPPPGDATAPPPAFAPAPGHGPARGSGEAAPQHGDAPGRLAALIDAAHGAAVAALSRRDTDSDFAAIAGLSGHLAAMRRTVYPAARRHPGAARQLLKICLARGRELDWVLRAFQGRLSGDICTMAYDVDGLSARLRLHAAGYRSAETALMCCLASRLPPGDRDQLAISYRWALARAPTRPHPRGPHTGPAYRVAFTLHSFWDRLLDAADSRPLAPPGPPGPRDRPA